MSSLSQREEAFLAVIKDWMGSGENREVYLAGSARGPIDLNESKQTFEIRDDLALSENLISALTSAGVQDVRVSGQQTLDLLNEMATEPFDLALRAAANDSQITDDEDLGISPGL